MQALVLVDLQNDFLPGGALAVPGGDAVVPLAGDLMKRFPLVAATQDWHPKGHGSFAVNHPGKKPGDIILLDGLEQILWPVHCVQETPGAALSAALDASRIDQVFQKGTDPSVDGYSGFFDNARRRATGLADFLKQKGATQVYIMGLATDYCVKFTALDAQQLGFQTHLIKDACRGVNLQPGDTAQAIAHMQAKGVHVIDSSDVPASQG